MEISLKSSFGDEAAFKLLEDIQSRTTGDPFSKQGLVTMVPNLFMKGKGLFTGFTFVSQRTGSRPTPSG